MRLVDLGKPSLLGLIKRMVVCEFPAGPVGDRAGKEWPRVCHRLSGSVWLRHCWPAGRVRADGLLGPEYSNRGRGLSWCDWELGRF